MTTKRYPESKDLSHSRKPRRPFQLPDHFTAAQPASPSEEHPVDLLIASLPGMAALRRRISRLRQVVQRQVRNQVDFIQYDDTRTDLACRSQEAYFNCGYERGHLAGVAESSTATGTSDPAVRAFQGQLCCAVAEAKLPKAKVAAALMDVARAVVLTAPTG